MTKVLNEHQFVEIMANIHLVTQALDAAVGPGIEKAIESFTEGMTRAELDQLDLAIILRIRELAEVHLKTASRQFRGARNGND